MFPAFRTVTMARPTQASRLPSPLHRAGRGLPRSQADGHNSLPKASKVRHSTAGRKRNAADAQLHHLPGAKNIRIQEDIEQVRHCECLMFSWGLIL